MWKLLFQSVCGPAHERNGQPCQDSCLVRLWPTSEGSVLVLACADGAGSAGHADAGARLACRGAARLILDDLRAGLPVARIEKDAALSWYGRLHKEIAAEAGRRGVEPGQLACTLLVAVVGETAAAFVQVGDGAIVVREGDEYRTVFWPQSGEYANTTNFITDPAFADNLVFARRAAAVDELALFTDGLQMLALNFAARTVHLPFFLPMFRKLRDAEPGEGLALALRSFLHSPAVNQRSDDDKTLVLATRVPPRAPDAQTV
jgi:serine/threonine protein phosphatase PrpC